MKWVLLIIVIVGLIIGVASADYSYNYNISFTYNIDPTMGTQSDYQIKFNLTNLTGISGYINGQNVIFTNGSTRADFFDVNFTDGSGNPQPFWIENNTCTAIGCTAWGLVPTIAVGNTSAGKWYFGNSSQSASTMNGVGTFLSWTDMNTPSLNASQFIPSPSVTNTISNGIDTITTTQTTDALGSQGFLTIARYGVNTSVRTRTSVSTVSQATGTYPGVGFTDVLPFPSAVPVNSATNGLYGGTGHQKWMLQTYNGSVGTTLENISVADTNYHVMEVSRMGFVTVNATVDDIYLNTSKTNIPYGNLNATAFAWRTLNSRNVDWFLVRKIIPMEPSISIIYGSPTNTLLSQFSSNTTTGYSSPYVVSFTDTSTGSPTTWNWSFGDGYTSTSQNPTHVYLVANAYTVSLNVTNSTGSYSVNSTTVTLNTDDDTYLKSWNHYNTTASLTSDEKGVAWSTSGSPTIDTAVKKFGAGSLNIPTGNHYIYSASSSIWDRSLVAGEIEFWINVSSLGDAGKPIIKRSTGATGTSDGWGFYNINGTQYGWSWWEGDAAANHTDGVYIPNNVWTNVKITRGTDNIERVYVDGALKTSKTGMTGGFDTANPLIIGSSTTGVEHAFRLDEFRFSQGVSREVGNFDVAMGQYNGSLTGGIDLSPNSTLRYKTNPGDTAIIYNQTGGGQRNRTVQIQNATAAKYISGGITYNPIRQIVKSVQLNLTNYPDLVLESSSINNVNGEATFNVSRGGTNTIEAMFDNRTNLVDFTMLYWNYTTDSTGEQYFSNGWIVDGGTYPVHNFLMTPITFGDWAFTSNFTASNTTPSAGQSVNFTDYSNGYPNRWNWSWGDGTWTNGSTTNVTSHAYTYAGTYNVSVFSYLYQNMSINSSQTRTSYMVVAASPNYNVMDMYQTGTYVRTVRVTDTSNVPLAGASVVWSNGQATTTDAAGYCNVSVGAGIYSFIASLSGYYPDQLSVAVEGDGTSSVQLEKMTSSQQNVWYTPWQVRIRIVDLYGAPLPLTNVTASYIATTLPSTNVTWLVSAFGIDSTVADDMLNSDVAMSGETDDNGGLSFTMFKSLQYRLTITNTSTGVASTKTLYPTDQEYVIYVRTAGQTTVNNTLITRNATLPWYSLNNTHISLNMTYWDTAGCTSDVTFRVWFRDNSTEIHNTTWSNIGTAKVYDNHTIAKAPIGTEYLWGYNATTVC